MGEKPETRVDVLLSPQEGMTGLYELRILVHHGKNTEAVEMWGSQLKLHELREGALVPVITRINENIFDGIKNLAENVRIRVMRTVYEQYKPEVEIEEAS